MSEKRERAAVLRELADAVRIEQNKIEEQRREDFLAGKLFHLHAQVQDGYTARFEEEFLREKKGKSMIERFDLATTEPFLGMVHVVELGVTTAPAADGDLDDLKDEYIELRDFLVGSNLLDREMTREESGRSLTVDPSPLTSELVIVARNRPLMGGRIELGVDTLVVGIAKRMVFSMPSTLYDAIATRFDDPGLKSEEALACVENLLERRVQSIGAIRTAYYLATQLD